jgi:hypothetical protein
MGRRFRPSARRWRASRRYRRRFHRQPVQAQGSHANETGNEAETLMDQFFKMLFAQKGTNSYRAVLLVVCTYIAVKVTDLERRVTVLEQRTILHEK